MVSLNLNRRHLTVGQRADIAVKLLPAAAAEAKERQRAAGDRGAEGGRGNKREETLDLVRAQGFDRAPRTYEIVGNMVGIGHATVGRMRKVMEESPELAEQVKRGEKTVFQAYNEIKQSKPKEEPTPGKDAGRVGVVPHSTAFNFGISAIA